VISSGTSAMLFSYDQVTLPDEFSQTAVILLCPKRDETGWLATPICLRFVRLKCQLKKYVFAVFLLDLVAFIKTCYEQRQNKQTGPACTVFNAGAD